jgi:heme A synthase
MARLVGCREQCHRSASAATVLLFTSLVIVRYTSRRVREVTAEEPAAEAI